MSDDDLDMMASSSSGMSGIHVKAENGRVELQTLSEGGKIKCLQTSLSAFQTAGGSGPFRALTRSLD